MCLRIKYVAPTDWVRFPVDNINFINLREMGNNRYWLHTLRRRRWQFLTANRSRGVFPAAWLASRKTSESKTHFGVQLRKVGLNLCYSPVSLLTTKTSWLFSYQKYLWKCQMEHRTSEFVKLPQENREQLELFVKKTQDSEFTAMTAQASLSLQNIIYPVAFVFPFFLYFGAWSLSVYRCH